MTKEQFGGQVREVVNGISAAFVAWGVLNDEKMAALGGVLVCLAMLFWGVDQKEGRAYLGSVLRKLLGAAGGAAVGFGLLTPDKSEALIAGILPILALWSSAKSNGVALNAGRFPVVLFFIGILSLSLPSCVVSVDDQGQVEARLDRAKASELLGKALEKTDGYVRIEK